MTNPNTLKPCPFCGGKGERNLINKWLDIVGYTPGSKYVFWVQCSTRSCLVKGPVGNTPEQANQKWNTRAECQ